MLNHENCWYGNVKSEAEKIGIELSRDRLQGMKKSKWKKFVKGKIKEAFQKEFEVKKNTMAKLRFLNNKAAETYLTYLTNEKSQNGINHPSQHV